MQWPLLTAACLLSGIGPVLGSWKYGDAAWQSHFVPIVPEDPPAPHPKAHTLVHPDSDLLSVLLAFRPSPLESGNARNQLRLFSKFFELSTLKEWVVVTPAQHVEETTHFFLKQIPAELPEVTPSLFRILSDGQCVPEFDEASPVWRDPSIEGYGYDKWVRQQVVKLGCAQYISTPFFIVIDADMFAVHPFKASDVFYQVPCDEGTIVCDPTETTGFLSQNDVELTGFDLIGNERPWHQDWWRASADFLQLDIQLDWPVVPGVTPQTLATHVAVELAKYIEARFSVNSWTGFLLDRADATARRNGAEGRMTTDPPAWTEYTLYFLFAHHAQLFDRYHQRGTVLQWRSVWDQEAFDHWDPCPDTFEWDLGFMSLVQSRMKLDPDLIWAKIEPCLQQLDAKVAQHHHLDAISGGSADVAGTAVPSESGHHDVSGMQKPQHANGSAAPGGGGHHDAASGHPQHQQQQQHVSHAAAAAPVGVVHHHTPSNLQVKQQQEEAILQQDDAIIAETALEYEQQLQQQQLTADAQPEQILQHVGEEQVLGTHSLQLPRQLHVSGEQLPDQLHVGEEQLLVELPGTHSLQLSGKLHEHELHKIEESARHQAVAEHAYAAASPTDHAAGSAASRSTTQIYLSEAALPKAVPAAASDVAEGSETKHHRHRAAIDLRRRLVNADLWPAPRAQRRLRRLSHVLPRQAS